MDKTQPTLFKCLTNTFRYFGGTPYELLFDNVRTVVASLELNSKKLYITIPSTNILRMLVLSPRVVLHIDQEPKVKLKSLQN